MNVIARIKNHLQQRSRLVELVAQIEGMAPEPYPSHLEIPTSREGWNDIRTPSARVIARYLLDSGGNPSPLLVPVGAMARVADAFAERDANIAKRKAQEAAASAVEARIAAEERAISTNSFDSLKLTRANRTRPLVVAKRDVVPSEEALDSKLRYDLLLAAKMVVDVLLSQSMADVAVRVGEVLPAEAAKDFMERFVPYEEIARAGNRRRSTRKECEQRVLDSNAIVEQVKRGVTSHDEAIVKLENLISQPRPKDYDTWSEMVAFAAYPGKYENFVKQREESIANKLENARLAPITDEMRVGYIAESEYLQDFNPSM